jgi:serine phosphatase RsbU (regulator of sigma subunit)
LSPFFGFSQNKPEDKLDSITNDIEKVDYLNELFLIYEFEDTTKAKAFLNQAKELGSKIEYTQGQALTEKYLGYFCEDHTAFDQAENHYSNYMEYAVSLNDQKMIADANNLFGNLNHNQSNYIHATDFYNKAKAYALKVKDTVLLAKLYNNLGVCFYSLQQYELAVENYQNAIPFINHLGQQEWLANVLDNLGLANTFLKNYDKAFVSNFRALEIRKELNDKKGIASASLNLGVIHSKLVDTINFENPKNPMHIDSAKLYINNALSIYKSYNDEIKISKCYHDYGTVLFNAKDYNSAADILLKGFKLSKKHQIIDDMHEEAKLLVKIYEIQEDWESSSKYYKILTWTNDSLKTGEAIRTIARLKMEHEFEKQELEYLRQRGLDSIRHKEENKRIETEKLLVEEENQRIETEKQLISEENQRKEAEGKRKDTVIFALIGGAFIFLIFMIILYRSFINKKNQNKLLAFQKEEISFKNEQITDSISYAQKIQQAILPPENEIKKLLPESFVLFLPKDIVSGDFYWTAQKGSKVFFAAVDCTGHGVPGAFISIMGYNGLNRTINEFGLTQPALILDKLNDIVNNNLRKSKQEDDIRDGMDIALCALDLSSNKLEYAGAFNPLIIVRNKDIIAIKGDKQPVGHPLDFVHNPFTNHEIKLEKNDMIYIFSDGFADQFGGKNPRLIERGGEKYKKFRLNNFLKSIAEEDVVIQKEKLHNEFLSWKGVQDQLDDVCIFGVKI